MTGYVGEDKTSEMYRKWKLYFKKYRDSPADKDNSIQDDVSFLEKKGLLRVGKYDVIEDIFNHVDTKAVFEIKLASQMIDNITLAEIQSEGMFMLVFFFNEQQTIEIKKNKKQ